MRTTISYRVDDPILENAVRDCICSGISPTKIKNIKKSIQGAVYRNGLNAIDFPEIWHVDDDSISGFPREKIDEIVSKLNGRIK